MAEVDYLVANQELVRTASSQSKEDLIVARCKIEDNINLKHEIEIEHLMLF